MTLLPHIFFIPLIRKARHNSWVALVALGLAALCAQPASSATTEAAPNAQTTVDTAGVVSVDHTLFTTLTFQWKDAARDRTVPAKLYLPAGPKLSAGTVPLVVFSHGIGGSMDGYTYLGRFFAAQGYASLHVQHVGSDRQIWWGNPLKLASRLSDAAQDSEALNRVKDVKFALDSLLGDPVGKLMDVKRLIAAGHSYGANTTMLLVGAKVDINGSTVWVKDPRFSAAILISAPPFYGLGDPLNIVSGIDVPTLHITATADDIQIPGYHSGVADRLALFQATGTTTQAAKVLAVFKDGSHSIFTDRMGTGGVALNPQIKVATRQLALAFLTWLHAKDTAALERWSGQNALLLAQFEKVAF
jgi:predicted dienelactone hydrolase